MNGKEFKKIFDCVAQSYGFESAFSGWLKESDECIVVLDLQKSNYGNYYDLNIKIYIQGIFGNTYKKNKDIIKRDIGDVFRRQPKEYNNAFSLDISCDNEKRKEKLELLFNEFIVPFGDKVLTRAGIKDLEQKGELFLLPAIKKELH